MSIYIPIWLPQWGPFVLYLLLGIVIQYVFNREEVWGRSLWWYRLPFRLQRVMILLFVASLILYGSGIPQPMLALVVLWHILMLMKESREELDRSKRGWRQLASDIAVKQRDRERERQRLAREQARIEADQRKGGGAQEQSTG